MKTSIKDNRVITPIFVNGAYYILRLPTSGEWDKMVTTLGDKAQQLMFADYMFSWCQDKHEYDHLKAIRGFYSVAYKSGMRPSDREVFIGYRPVLEPVDPETFLPDPTHLSHITDGAHLNLGGLLINGELRSIPQDPTMGGDILKYYPYSRACLRIVSNCDDSDTELSWIKCGNLLWSDRNLLTLISWNDLNKAGLVYGDLKSYDFRYFNSLSFYQKDYEELKGHWQPQRGNKIVPTYIDGKPYAVRLLTGGSYDTPPDVTPEWDEIVNFLMERDEIFHYRGLSSWTQDQIPNRFNGTLFIHRGGQVYPYGYFSNSIRNDSAGYRPVLEPLNPDTLEPNPSALADMEDGTFVKLGTLYMGKAPVRVPNRPYEFGDNDMQEYVPGEKLYIGDTDKNPENQIQFIKHKGILVADRNLLRKITWGDLHRQGLVFGDEPKKWFLEGESKPRFNIKNTPL